jgi:hypothetical protein
MTEAVEFNDRESGELAGLWVEFFSRKAQLSL